MPCLLVCAKSLQLCLTLCDPPGCSPPGSSVHGLLQERILKWVACHSLLQGIFPTQGLNLHLSCLLPWLVLSGKPTEVISSFVVVQSLSLIQSLRPHGLQYARLLSPSLSHGDCWNSCPLSRWCHPTISISVIPSPPALNLSWHQGLFHWVGCSHQVAKVLELQLQHQSFQWIFRTDFL